MMVREDAVASARHHFDSGAFKSDLARLIARPTESQDPNGSSALLAYIEEDMRPRFEALGFTCAIWTEKGAPSAFLFAERIEAPNLPTILGYGHGDVIRGMDELWSDGLSPWTLTEVNGRWYGRGIADNKGQHAINMAALQSVIETRGALGFNAKYLIEMGEEIGSPGLRTLCEKRRDALRADVLIASDGPRFEAGRPTIFLGTRGVATFDLTIRAREGGHHSGNWGGILSDPAIQLAHAISTIVSKKGRILIDAWVPDGIPDSVREALSSLAMDGGKDGPEIDGDWGEPGLSPAEQVFAWCSFDVLAMSAGHPNAPVNAVPPSAWARCQLRFVVGIDASDIVPALRRHLDHHGFGYVDLVQVEEISLATRLDPRDPWVTRVATSMERVLGVPPVILPNLGGTLPNDIFGETLGLRTIWIPHSYPGCLQHAPDEHLPVELVREGLAVMAGLYWDLGVSLPAAPA